MHRRDQAGGTTQDPSWEPGDDVVERYWPVVYRLSFRLSGSRHEAEDIAQETFYRALHKSEQYVAGSSMRAWLCRIATNIFLDGRRRRREVLSQEALARAADRSPGVSAGQEARELADCLQQAMLQLSEAQRVVFMLRTTEDMPFSQIAEILGIGEAGARWHMLQARRELMRLLDGRL